MDQGLVLLAGWGQLLLLAAVLSYFVLRDRP